MMHAKRQREDGAISRQQYEAAERFGEAEQPVSVATKLRAMQALTAEETQGTWTKASPETLAGRRKLAIQRNSKLEEFARELRALNKAVTEHFRREIGLNPFANLIDAAQDYITYVSQLEDRYMRTHGEVLTFGSGDCGQLAHGTEDDNDLMVKFPRIVHSLRDKQVVQISCGGLHNACVTQDGRVYTWGCNDDGSLGRTGEETMPGLVEGVQHETIVKVSCGDSQTMAMSLSGKVYGWGSYKDKEGKKWFCPSAPGGTDIKKQQNTPLQIIGINNAIDIASGVNVNIVRCADGRVLAWGLGECGELSRPVCPLKKNGEYDFAGMVRDHLTPREMIFAHNKLEVRDVIAIGAGAYHVMIVMGMGSSVYSCGLNNYGQLGHGDTESRNELTLIEALEGLQVVSVTGGMHHSLVLTSAGHVYAFGRGDSGQLGTAGTLNPGYFQELPQRVTFPDAQGVPKEIACGANHNLVLTTENEVFTWGFGDMLALGHGKDKDEPLPRKINFTKSGVYPIQITQVAGGGQHSAIIAQVRSSDF